MQLYTTAHETAVANMYPKLFFYICKLFPKDFCSLVRTNCNHSHENKNLTNLFPFISLSLSRLCGPKRHLFQQIFHYYITLK